MSALLVTALILTRLHLTTVEPSIDRAIGKRLDRREVTAKDLPWPARLDTLPEIGRGAAIVFSPDLATPDNRNFYEGLGFVYVESADWEETLETLEDVSRERQINTVIVESHGANGNGLKLQTGKLLLDRRSYISLGGLQERLSPLGVNVVLLSACNAGRLFRPEIYNALDRRNPDPLFLPPTLGVVDASSSFDRKSADVRLLRRSKSELETIMEVSARELPSALRLSVSRPLPPDGRVTISTMLMQTLLRDQRLIFTGRGFVSEKSRGELSEPEREELLRRFLRELESRASANL